MTVRNRWSLLSLLSRVWPLLVGLALALFPFGWLGEVWPGFGRWLGGVFNSDWMHAVGHSLIFCLVGLIVLNLFPSLLVRPRRYLSLTLVIGLGQEAIQLLYKRRSAQFDDFRDLLSDLAGLLIALAITWLWQTLVRRQHRSSPQQTRN